MNTELQPAPFDWHKANKYLPAEDEIVIVRGLYPGWAKYIVDTWTALDACGNHRAMTWAPEYWRRQYFPTEPL